MNSFLRRLALSSLTALLGVGVAHADVPSAQSPQLLASASYPNRSNNNVDDGAIRRANPNSRQGTQPIAPVPRNSTLNTSPQRMPTLENGGIGNGYPTRQQSPRPSSNARGSN
ncbi:hypothetical protein [Pseudomonas sp. SLFW]|uniref:hypothetical protein n=1 Tax=Pseudomonas sp. SLFW TaxID=2683259 RepID=UPI001412A015|nr:hypothetical protein [Pseudomonas sp. SLFW]NBB12506.1 hypothetical protein [Pseudomonas sp. SLFW]